MQIETPSQPEKTAPPPPPAADAQPKKSSLMMNTKRAREYSFLGMYEEANKAYTDAMSELKVRKANCRGKPELHETYKLLEKDLIEEVTILNFQWEMIKTGVVTKTHQQMSPEEPETPPARQYTPMNKNSDPTKVESRFDQPSANAQFNPSPFQQPPSTQSRQNLPKNRPENRPEIRAETRPENQEKKLPFNFPPFAFHHIKTNPENFNTPPPPFHPLDDMPPPHAQNKNFQPNRGSQQRIAGPNVPYQTSQNPYPGPPQYNQPFENFSNNFGAVDLQQKVVAPPDYSRAASNTSNNQGGQTPPSIPGLRGQYPPNMNEGRGSRNANFSNPPQFKDPDVWDPPSPRPMQKAPPRNQAPLLKKTSLPAPSTQNQVKTKDPLAQAQGSRNYDRPWMNGVPQKQDKPKADPDGRYRFLYHHYPDGNGPDADLIRGLEDTVFTASCDVTFDSIAGLEDAKENLRMYVVMALHMRDFFKDIRSPPKGILLFGPPGTGKTMLAKAIATTGKTTFLNVNPSTLASKWRGDSEKLVRILFEMARFYAPSTVFIDEIDSLLSERSSTEHESSRKVKTQFFTEIDGVVSNQTTEDGPPNRVFILAATNRPWDLDEAILRRLTKRIYIPLPNNESRRKMFQMNLKGINLAPDIDLDYLVENTNKYNSSDIISVCQEASMAPLRKRMKNFASFQETVQIQNLQQEMLKEPITMEDFKEALKKVKSSASDKHTAQYEEWMAEHGSN